MAYSRRRASSFLFVGIGLSILTLGLLAVLAAFRGNRWMTIPIAQRDIPADSYLIAEDFAMQRVASRVLELRGIPLQGIMCSWDQVRHRVSGAPILRGEPAHTSKMALSSGPRPMFFRRLPDGQIEGRSVRVQDEMIVVFDSQSRETYPLEQRHQIPRLVE